MDRLLLGGRGDRGREAGGRGSGLRGRGRESVVGWYCKRARVHRPPTNVPRSTRPGGGVCLLLLAYVLAVAGKAAGNLSFKGIVPPFPTLVLRWTRPDSFSPVACSAAVVLLFRLLESFAAVAGGPPSAN